MKFIYDVNKKTEKQIIFDLGFGHYFNLSEGMNVQYIEFKPNEEMYYIHSAIVYSHVGNHVYIILDNSKCEATTSYYLKINNCLNTYNSFIK